MSLALLQRGQNPNKKPWMVPDSLTHNAGTITAIFGLTTYSVILSGLVANTRYQLYVVPGGTLVYSTNEHSVGPAGYTSWILIGSFYSNGQTVVAFGSFVGIDGKPKSNTVLTTPSSSWNTNVTYFGSWERDGEWAKVHVSMSITGAIAAADLTFTNAQLFNGTLAVDNSKLPKPGGYIAVGTSSYEDSGTANRGGITVDWGVAANFLRFRGSNFTDYNGGAGTPIVWVNGDSISFDCELPIVGWSNIPIKDL